MQNLIFFILFLSLPVMAAAQPLHAFQLFDSQGEKVAFDDMVATLQEADVVFFGEQHNNPIAHWMQLELSRRLYDGKGEQLMLGAEMFEADDQLLLNEYLAGLIAEKNFEQEARVWNNYQTDYKPLVLLAKSNDLPFIATNIPRRYANLVYREGLEALEQLSMQARSYIAPLPIVVDMDLPGYKNMMRMMSGHGGDGNTNLVQAQAVKDATMAHFIATTWEANHLLLHFNGSYHSDNEEGILWYLERYRPGLNMHTITTVSQEEVDTLLEDNKGKADYILCVPDNMTKTY